MSVALGRLSLTITMNAPARRAVPKADPAPSDLERSARRASRHDEAAADRMRWLLAAQRVTRW